MPVQLILRSPKGGRVLAEREYADGYRIDAVSGWLVVVDRNGSVIAAHAACPGLEGAVVEYASAVVSSEPAGEVEHADGTRSSTLRDAIEGDDDDRFADELMLDLRRLGDEYGPLGVAIAAATLTNPRVLVAHITDTDVRDPRPEPESESDLFRQRNEAVADAERYAAALTTLERERDEARGRADRAELEAGTWRREVEEQTARAEREHAGRLNLERRVEELLANLALYRDRLDAPAEPVELYVPVAARVSWNGSRLRALYLRPHDGEVGSEQYLDGKGRPLTIEDVREEQVGYPPDAPRPAYRVDGPVSVEFRKAGQRFDYLPVPEDLDLRAHPAALRVAGPGLVTFDGREIRVEYDPAEARLATTDQTGAPLRLVPRPVDEDPRRPHPDSWPDDAVLLTYRELRRLVTLHLERYGVAPEVCRAVLEADVPLRLGEVLA